ncbi:MAG: hypothetical protein ACKON8_09185 [Planctomycetota bacterium]
MTTHPPTDRPSLPEWLQLATHAAALDATHLRDLFARDADRGERFVIDACGLHVDYSKQRITDETLRGILLQAPRRLPVKDRSANGTSAPVFGLMSDS